MTATCRLLRGLLVVLSLVCTLAPLEASQSASAAELKAAFVFNFAKFAEWPDLGRNAPLVFCVAGDDRFIDALAQHIRGQRVRGHSLTAVKLSPGIVAVKGCHILFVGTSQVTASGPLLEGVRDVAVLTVSDSPRFAETHGIVELYSEGDRIKFAVNLDSVQRSKVRLSSTMLKMAKIVRDNKGGSRF